MSLSSILQNNFKVVVERSSTSELVILCPDCDDRSGHRSFNLNKPVTFCYKCGKGGSAVHWLRAHGLEADGMEQPLGVTVHKVSARLNEVTRARRHILAVRPISLPHGFTRLSDAPRSIYTRLISRMAEEKNLALNDLIQAGAGFTSEDPKWEEYAIFPVIWHGTVRYYQGRAYSAGTMPAKRFPSRMIAPDGFKRLLYNLDAVGSPQVKTVILVESILNVLSFNQKLNQLGRTDIAVVAAFTSHISNYQALHLMRRRLSHVEEVCIFFDADATSKAWEHAPRFLHRFRVTIAQMPENGTRNFDPNDDIDVAWAAFENRKEYTPTAHLQRRLSNFSPAADLVLSHAEKFPCPFQIW